MPKLYEVRIYEPQVLDGLSPRPKRIRLTNCWQLVQDRTDGKPLKYCGGTYLFVEGKSELYDFVTKSLLPAEIVGEIDASRSMEADRFSPD